MFENGQQFKECISKYGISNGYQIKWVRSSDNIWEAKCSGECEWKIYASRTKRERTVQVRIYNGAHSCYRNLTNRLATFEWIAKELMQRFRRNLDYEIDDMVKDVREKYALTMNKRLCYKARYKALSILIGKV